MENVSVMVLERDDSQKGDKLMLDPKKLIAYIEKENKKNPLQSSEEDEEEMGEEEVLDEEMNVEGQEVEEAEDQEMDEEGITPEQIEDIAMMIEDGEGDPLLLQLAGEFSADMAEFGDEMDSTPAWASDRELWAKAEAAVDPAGAGSKYSDPYAVVAHVYKELGGAIA